MAPPQYACNQCGSTQFDEDDGKWYCHNGHEQEGGQQIGEDDGDFARAGKVRRQKEVKEKQKVLKVYRGVRGFRLFLKAWQYILWRQCYALIHQHGLPEELWALVRELWALRLSKLERRLEEREESSQPLDSDLLNSVESGKDIDDTEFEPKSFKRKKQIDDNPILSDTISLNYVGILILRYPKSLALMYRYIRQEEVCYIRAIRHVPQAIKDHLAPEYHLALDTITIPTEHDLQLSVYRSATMYGEAFDMFIPSLNWRLILLEDIKHLSLPLEIFTMVKFLANMLEFKFAYPLKHTERRNATTFPQAQLMALIIVATKLVFPFDSDTSKVYPQSVNEPAVTKMNWHVWLNIRIRQQPVGDKPDTIPPARAIEVTDADVLQMSESQLDSYMDWFQQTYAKETQVDSVQQQVLDMFPVTKPALNSLGAETGDNSQGDTVARLRSIQAELKPRRIIVNSEKASPHTNILLRPGQQYQQYRSLDVMSEPALHFHKEAAQLACLDIDSLIRACLRVERLLLIHQHEQRREEHFADGEQTEFMQ